MDAILTRMGAYDSMFSHSSTFKVELDETSKILSTATPHSLVILDELGRGTSTFDGIAIAGAVLHHLATHTLALACFATHYSSLTEDYGKRPGVRCMHMATGFDDEKREVRVIFDTGQLLRLVSAYLALQTHPRNRAVFVWYSCCLSRWRASRRCE